MAREFERNSVVARTAGAIKRRRFPPPSINDLKDAVEQAIADEVYEQMRKQARNG